MLGRAGRRPKRWRCCAPCSSTARSRRAPTRCSAPLATLILIANDELEAARARCDALIDLARPRGWLIALAHGSFMRAMALVRAGEIRDAEADARLAFDFKLAVAPRPRCLWSLCPRSSTR